jgi:hypothetical protein
VAGSSEHVNEPRFAYNVGHFLSILAIVDFTGGILLHGVSCYKYSLLHGMN